MTLERHVGTWTADEEKIRRMSGMIRYSKGDYAQAETAFERALTTTRHESGIRWESRKHLFHNLTAPFEPQLDTKNKVVQRQQL